MERDKEKLSAQLQSGDYASDGKRVEALLREKAQLHQRLCSLEAEVAELRAERDSTGAQAENTHRIQLRQLAESQAALKSLEVRGLLGLLQYLHYYASVFLHLVLSVSMVFQILLWIFGLFIKISHICVTHGLISQTGYDLIYT